VTIDGSKITGRYIDILSRRGADTGKRFEYRKDLTEIERTIDMSSVKTAIRAYGKPTEDENGDQGKPITFKEIEWSKAKGDPIDKPKGQDWLGDEQARALWGRGDYEGKRHRFGILEESDEDNPVRLLEQTYEYLQTVCTPLVHYSGKVVDLFRLSNFEHERIQLGDTAAVLDEDIYPVIQEKTRVIELKRDLLDPSNDEVVLGEFLPLFSNPNQEMERVLAKVKENSHVWDRAGRPIQPNSYPDIVPEVPANVTATGLYAAVMVEWDFSHLDTHIAGFEVYASEVQGFAGNPETLVYRGFSNTYGFHGEPNKQYYFRVRAFNYHERYSPLSEEVSATTARIVSEDIFFGEDLAAKLRELSKEAQIIADGSINLDQLEESVREQLQQDAKQYTDEEIKAVTEQINSELAEKAGLEYVDGKFQFTDGKLAELDSITDNLTREVGDINGTVSNIATNVDVIEGELSATASRLTNIDGKLSAQEADIRANADAISARITKDEFEDTTGQLSSQIGELELTASGLRTDFGELSKTVEGVSEKQSNFETTINGLKADVSNVETRVDNNAGAITNVSSRTSQLELRADRFSTTISELSHVATTGDNIIPDGSFEGGGLGWHGPGEIVDDAYSGKKALEFKGGSSPRTRSQSVTNPVAVVPGHTYRISYWYKTSADANGVRDNQKLRFGNADTGTLVTDWGWDGAQTEWRQIKGTWKCPSNVKALSVSMVTNHSVGWVRVDDIEVVDVSEVTNLQTSIDQNAREISLVASDTSALGNRMSQAESKLSVQADQINARVEKNGVIAAINLSSEGVRIDGAKTRITGQTLIDNGVIKTAHIGEAAVGTAAIANASISKAKLQNAIIGTAQIENGAITNAKIGNGQIDNAKIANATITNAKISDISAAKITSGTLDAANIMVRAMNGSMAVQMDADGFKAFDSNARNRILIGIRNFNGQGSDPALVRFFDPGGKNMGYVGANTNDTFTIYSASSTFIDSVDRIISRSGEFRFDPMRGSTGSRYWVMGRGNTSSKSGLHPTFRPDTSGWGLVGMSNFRLWEVWTNNMHYFTMHKISSRNVKENIEPLDLDYFARLIDQVELMSYHYKTPDRNGAYVRPNYGPISEDLPEEFRTPSDEGPALSMDDFIAGILAKVKVQDRIMKEQANAIKEIQKQVNALKGGR
jgi:hypothetical protein